jgi:hypothetical protein
MKKIMGFMAVYAIVMVSCQKETADQNVDLTNAASTELSSTSGVSSTDASNSLELRGKHKPGRDSSCIRIPVDRLAQAIKDYVATNYSGSTIEFAFTDKSGNFFTAIKLADGTFKLLQFDSAGTFLKELDRKVPGPKNPRKHLTRVDVNTLPTAIITYVDTNYTGANILRAGTTPGGEYIVVIDVNGTHKALLFDANGNFIKELK